jgi:precorrin-6B methylase 1
VNAGQNGAPRPGAGSLTVVGTGIHAAAHTTPAAQEAIMRADKVLFAVVDRMAAEWICQLNASAEPLGYDTSSASRRAVYERMVARILDEVRQCRNVCAVFYGHPGVFAYATHASIRAARKEGFVARMLPGISAEDCLVADLGLDPSALGLQSYEATDFLIRPRQFDSSTTLLLWQIGLLGNMGFFREGQALAGLDVLLEVLTPRYGSAHRTYVYEASTDGVTLPRVEAVRLSQLRTTRINAISTLLVPAVRAAALDLGTMNRLGVNFAGECTDISGKRASRA